jgi:hypothetical protein
MKTPNIPRIQSEMKTFYGFDLTEKQILDWFKTQSCGSCFGIIERESFAHFLSNLIVGKDWPKNKDSQEYKDDFFRKLKENAPKLGYITLIR